MFKASLKIRIFSVSIMVVFCLMVSFYFSIGAYGININKLVEPKNDNKTKLRSENENSGVSIKTIINQPTGISKLPKAGEEGSVTESTPLLGQTAKDEFNPEAWTTLHFEDFSPAWPDNGWSVSCGNPSWGLTSYKYYSALYSAWCARSGSLGCDPASCNYSNDMTACMIYGPFDLRCSTDAYMSLWLWLETEENYDFVYFGASTDGTNFNLTDALSGSSDGVFEYWEYDLSSLCGNSNVWVMVYFESDASINFKGAFVDDVSIKALTSPPVLSSFSINSGANYTCSQTVTLNNSATTCPPTHYMASESSSFSGASWLTYSAAPSFTLSSGCGTKTVYFKVKNANGESSVLSDTIRYLTTPVISSFLINNGAANTTSQAVTLNNSASCTPTHYMASESSNFSGASWQTYSTAPSFTLSSGCNVTKTVYFKVKNECAESSTMSDTIQLNCEGQSPILNSFAINSGAICTNNQTVTLNNAASNSPTHYMASESSTFSGASWLAYSTAPSFALSSGYNTKTVYLKVKNTYGESNILSDTINYQQICPTVWEVPLTITSNNTAINPQQCIFGTHQTATDGFDNGIDVPSPFLPPGSIDLFTYFWIDDPITNMLTKDMRREITPHSSFDEEWEFHARADKVGFKICWDISGLPLDLFANITQTIPSGGASNIDMRSQSCIFLNSTGDYTFKIRVKGGCSNFILNFMTGWNMVSIPGTLCASFPSNSNLVTDSIYTYDPVAKNYVKVPLNQVTLGDGYWFLATANTQVIIQIQPVSAITLPVKTGWNMVGSINTDVPTSCLTTNPSNVIVTDSVYTYDPAIKNYKKVTNVAPGVGHWMLATQNATLTMAPCPPPPPSSVTLLEQTVWEIPLTVTSDNQSITSQGSSLGTHSDATDGYNIGIDDPAPLEPPGTVDLFSYFWIDDPVTNMLTKDVRKEMSHSIFNKTWEFHVRADKVGFKVCWNISGLPSDLTATITQISPAGGPANVNMRNQNCIICSQKGLYEFAIKVTSGTSFTSFRFKLKEGWNLMSFAVNKCFYEGIPPAGQPSGVEMVPVASMADWLSSVISPEDAWEMVVGPDGAMDRYLASFHSLKYMSLAEGYWVKIKSGTSWATIAIEGQAFDLSKAIHLKQGWNLVGYPSMVGYHDTASEPSIELPEGATWEPVSAPVAAHVFQSIAGKYSMIMSDDGAYNPSMAPQFSSLHYVAPGHACWIKMDEAADLIYGQ